MQQNLVENLQFKADIDFVSENSACFKSTEYPPKGDFVVSIDKDGKTISRYMDDSWDFRHFGNPNLMYFHEYDDENKKLFKQVVYYIIYSHLFPSKYISLRGWYLALQALFKQCTKSGIQANQLSRHPKVIEAISKEISTNTPSSFQIYIFYFHQLFKNKDQIGFTLLNERAIGIFKSFDPKYKLGQTPYIPVKIWTKLIQHIKVVFDDFEAHHKELEELYHYTALNTIENKKNGIKQPSPFDSIGPSKKIKFNGSLEDYLIANDLLQLFEKYEVRPNNGFNQYQVQQFSSLLNNIVASCYLYVLNYSIMRKLEANKLRLDCLRKEKDSNLGSFTLLAGETTKTDPDSDDRWIVPYHVDRAINIASTIVSWKLKHKKITDESEYIFQRVEIWNSNGKASTYRNFDKCTYLMKHGADFFNVKQFVITQSDYDEAIALTPSLLRKDWFKVGNIWQFGFHQFRRTLAVHFALNQVSPSSTQVQMKHSTREQQYHYQNNAGRLRLNHLAEQEVVNEYYAEMARNIASVVHGDAVLPHKQSPVKQDVVCFVEEGEMKKLLKAQKNGAVGYRKNLLGGCMKQGTCEYGGFDSITHCAGGTGGNMCSDLIIDGSREQEFEDDKAYYEEQMDEVPEDSPRYGALKAEVRGYEKVLDVIKTKKGGAK
ncbi:hypothetical protein [Thiomicrorhabdus sp.]|uniref:hypothetical protein n=1 Tax=Thiomicrorhabdus sp. TaxID=2039724 RepID=UPI002AA6A74D|nr:hypothetical protein [Thiomicrorhabdus sp.]